jgi:hypothetical protein
MKIFTKLQIKKLKENGEYQEIAQLNDTSMDFYPVVKLFTPDANATWLLTEIVPGDGHPTEEVIAFGLCDLGLGSPELGYVSITELATVKGPFGLSIERDRHFEGRYPISVYAEAARHSGRIVENIKDAEAV